MNKDIHLHKTKMTPVKTKGTILARVGLVWQEAPVLLTWDWGYKANQGMDRVPSAPFKGRAQVPYPNP